MSDKKLSPQYHDDSLERNERSVNQIRSETDYRQVILVLLFLWIGSDDLLDIRMIPMIWDSFNANSNSVISRCEERIAVYTLFTFRSLGSL